MKENVLVVGRGGREHALAWKLRRSPEVAQVWLSGSLPSGGDETVVAISSAEEIVGFCLEKKVGLVIIGPEDFLLAGLADALRANHIPVVGPSAGASRLEGSKSYAKDLMTSANIPTARYRVVRDSDSAKQVLAASSYPVVVKADGLCGGKGVRICADADEAQRYVDDLLGASVGSTVVIEEFLEGREVSFMTICCGENVVVLPTSQDYKRLLDGDDGANTGGMGAFSPSPLESPALERAVLERVIYPVIRRMKQLGYAYHGFLYAGLMVHTTAREGDVPDFSVLEFNCRLGDPETQVILPRIAEDLFPLLRSLAQGEMTQRRLSIDSRCAVGVTLASAGYPQKPMLDSPVSSLPTVDGEDVHLFHAGTRRAEDGSLRTSGGRVLNLVALEESHTAAREKCYRLIDEVYFEGMQYRRDIAQF